jgi:hypothetical protein
MYSLPLRKTGGVMSRKAGFLEAGLDLLDVISDPTD